MKKREETILSYPEKVGDLIESLFPESKPITKSWLPGAIKKFQELKNLEDEDFFNFCKSPIGVKELTIYKRWEVDSFHIHSYILCKFHEKFDNSLENGKIKFTTDEELKIVYAYIEIVNLSSNTDNIDWDKISKQYLMLMETFRERFVNFPGMDFL